MFFLSRESDVGDCRDLRLPHRAKIRRHQHQRKLPCVEQISIRKDIIQLHALNCLATRVWSVYCLFSPLAANLLLPNYLGVSDYIFNCPASQTCGIYQDGTYWGCCKEILDTDCGSHLYCPMYSSCIDSTALGSCDSDCITDPRILKWFVMNFARLRHSLSSQSELTSLQLRLC